MIKCESWTLSSNRAISSSHGLRRLRAPAPVRHVMLPKWCLVRVRLRYLHLAQDSTPDVSHTDQVTFTVRYVGVKGEPVERFLEFIASEERHTGENLREIVLSALSRLNLNIEDLRGQSYDNAANMSGCYSGLQANIKQTNSLADFVPCAAHSLNLVGTASVSSCLEAIKFFGIVHEIYNFAVRSTRHWNVLTNGLRSNETEES